MQVCSAFTAVKMKYERPAQSHTHAHSQDVAKGGSVPEMIILSKQSHSEPGSKESKTINKLDLSESTQETPRSLLTKCPTCFEPFSLSLVKMSLSSL